MIVDPFKKTDYFWDNPWNYQIFLFDCNLSTFNLFGVFCLLKAFHTVYFAFYGFLTKFEASAPKFYLGFTHFKIFLNFCFSFLDEELSLFTFRPIFSFLLLSQHASLPRSIDICKWPKGHNHWNIVIITTKSINLNVNNVNSVLNWFNNFYRWTKCLFRDLFAQLLWMQWQHNTEVHSISLATE